MSNRLTRSSLLVATIGLCAAELPASTIPKPEAGKVAPGLTTAQDGYRRLTIPVMVNGRGPYPFVIDTGADRTVVSSELAATLHLPPGPAVSMNDTAGVQKMPTTHIDRLDMGERRIDGIDAPVIPAAALGADGMLGLDALHGQRVVMDFDKRQFTSTPSQGVALDGFNSIIVYGRRRFGRLVLVDAESQGTPIFVIMDSGAQSTIGNTALQRLITGRSEAASSPLATVISVTGNQTPARLNRMPQIRLGAVTISNIPIAYADLHTFAEFGLSRRPAMLLGMDTMHMFSRVAVDFATREVTFVAR